MPKIKIPESAHPGPLALAQVDALERDHAETVFYALAEKWKRETGHFSVFGQRTDHAAYQGIIALQEKALPLLIRELQHSPRNWFWALRQIAKCNPVRKGASVEQAAEDWTAWWEDRIKRNGGLD